MEREGSARQFVERSCLLFEAGEYPDRGVVVTADDLAEIAANTAPEVPVRMEHLPRSPIDGELGVMMHIRAEGRRLWGTLRQPRETWEVVRRAGARALSVGLDVARKRIAEVSLVCRPRVADARIFSDGLARFAVDLVEEGKEDDMGGVRQLAEGVMEYIRGALGRDGEAARKVLDHERAALERDREAFAEARVDSRIAELKRRGLLRATDAVDSLARVLLRTDSVVYFGAERLEVADLFQRFLEANGSVVPMGEVAASDGLAGGSARDSLVRMARDEARKENIPFVMAFSRVTAAHPDMARAARENL